MRKLLALVLSVFVLTVPIATTWAADDPPADNADQGEGMPSGGQSEGGADDENGTDEGMPGSNGDTDPGGGDAGSGGGMPGGGDAGSGGGMPGGGDAGSGGGMPGGGNAGSGGGMPGGGDTSGEGDMPGSDSGSGDGGSGNGDAGSGGGMPGGGDAGSESDGDAGSGGGMPGGESENGGEPGGMPGGDTGEGGMPGGGESGGMPGGGDESGGMPGGGDMGGGAPSKDTSKVYVGSDDDLTDDVKAELANFTYADDDYDASGVTFDGYTGTATVGSDDLKYDADDIKSYVEDQGLSAETQKTTDHYLDYLGNDEVAGFIVLGAADGGDDASPGNASPGNAITNTAGTVYVENMYAQVSGAVNAAVSGRYGLATMGNSNATSVVKDSYVIQTGQTDSTADVEEPGSNDGLLISGHGRANFSVGNTSTYYINSSVVTEGWAAMSTDSASNNGLYLYSYNSDAVAEDGGYGVYADSGCNDYLYGSRLTSAELGIIISNNGSVTMSDTDDTPDAVEAYLDSSDEVGSNTRSTVTAGRNDVQIHSPGMSMGSGGGMTDSAQNAFTLNLSHTDLVTTDDLETTEDYETKYSKAVDDYLDLVDGANILVKSTYGTITLDDVTATSSRESENGDYGVLLMTVLNSDSSSRYVTDGDVATVTADIGNCEDLTGDILNFDYQRAVDVNLTDSLWSGRTYSWSQDDWNSYWKVLDVTENSEDDAVYWILGDEYARDGGTDTTLNLSGSTWNVTGESSITDLTMDDDSRVVVGDAATLTIDSGTYAGTYQAGDVIGGGAADDEAGDNALGASEAQIDVGALVMPIIGGVLAVVAIVTVCVGLRRIGRR